MRRSQAQLGVARAWRGPSGAILEFGAAAFILRQGARGLPCGCEGPIRHELAHEVGALQVREGLDAQVHRGDASSPSPRKARHRARPVGPRRRCGSSSPFTGPPRGRAPASDDGPSRRRYPRPHPRARGLRSRASRCWTGRRYHTGCHAPKQASRACPEHQVR